MTPDGRRAGSNDGMDSSRFLRGIIAVNGGSQPHQEEADMDATTVAVDLAKDVFEVAVANHAQRIMDRKRLTRRQFESFIDCLATGTAVVMEACGRARLGAALPGARARGAIDSGSVRAALRPTEPHCPHRYGSDARSGSLCRRDPGTGQDRRPAGPASPASRTQPVASDAGAST